jgi:hypothetical protein
MCLHQIWSGYSLIEHRIKTQACENSHLAHQDANLFFLQLIISVSYRPRMCVPFGHEQAVLLGTIWMTEWRYRICVKQLASKTRMVKSNITHQSTNPKMWQLLLLVHKSDRWARTYHAGQRHRTPFGFLPRFLKWFGWTIHRLQYRISEKKTPSCSEMRLVAIESFNDCGGLTGVYITLTPKFIADTSPPMKTRIPSSPIDGYTKAPFRIPDVKALFSFFNSSLLYCIGSSFSRKSAFLDLRYHWLSGRFEIHQIQ